MRDKHPISFFYIIKVFSFIGATSFGGYTALISYVQKKLVDDDNTVLEEDLLDSITVASLLPGPLAVNVVAYIGYQMRGWIGSLLAITSLLLPSVLLMMIAAEFYLQFGDLDQVESFLSGIILVICGIVFSVVYKMGTKHLSSTWQVLLTLLTCVSLFFVKGYFATMELLAFGAVVGAFMSRAEIPRFSSKENQPFPIFGAFLIVSIVTIIVFVFGDSLTHQLALVFSKVSLTLFGGGYVMIPILYDLVVSQQDWISAESFSIAISMGQMTPGPILVSATYVGYLVHGVSGALVSTAAIFLPSAIAMVLVSNRFEQLKSSTVVFRALQGIRPVIIGLIAYSCVLLFMSNDFSWIRLLLALIVAILLIFTKINHFLLMLMIGCLGLFLF